MIDLSKSCLIDIENLQVGQEVHHVVKGRFVVEYVNGDFQDVEYPIKCHVYGDKSDFYTFTRDGKHVSQDKFPSIFLFNPLEKAAYEVAVSNKRIQELEKELSNYRWEEERRNALPY